jgi:hypothetical protein
MGPLGYSLYYKKVSDVLGAIDAEAAATQRMYDTEQALMDNRPTAEAAGVDISPIKALDPTFNDQDFLTIARESFYSIREARSTPSVKLEARTTPLSRTPSSVRISWPSFATSSKVTSHHIGTTCFRDWRCGPRSSRRSTPPTGSSR